MPVLALALVTQAYITDADARRSRDGGDADCGVAPAASSRTVGTLETSDGTSTATIGDDLVVWLSRVIDAGRQHLRRLGAPGVERAQSCLRRACCRRERRARCTRRSCSTAVRRQPDEKPSANTRIWSPPRRSAVQNRDAILTVPLTLAPAGNRRADRRARSPRAAGRRCCSSSSARASATTMAERIADPVNRLTRATGRIARGDLDARIRGNIIGRTPAAGRGVQPHGGGSAASARASSNARNRLAAWADMARQVAHDIKNPLTPIQLYAEHLRRVHMDKRRPLGRRARRVRRHHPDAGASAAADCGRVLQLRLVAHTASGADIARRLVRGSGRQSCAPQPASPAACQSRLDVPETLPLLMVDRTILGRALTNIDRERAARDAWRRDADAHSAGRPTGHAVLAIADTGVGMDRACARPHRSSPTSPRRASGTGLGLHHREAERGAERRARSRSPASAARAQRLPSRCQWPCGTRTKGSELRVSENDRWASQTRGIQCL